MGVGAWLGAAPPRPAPPASTWLRAGAPDPAPAASVVEIRTDVTEALLRAEGHELSALALAGWRTDLGSSPSLWAWVRDRADEEPEVARAVAVVDGAAPRGLHLRVEADAAVLWLARHRRGVLVHVLMARRWAAQGPRARVERMAARLGMSALPRRRTTAWRALAAVQADAAWLSAELQAHGTDAADAAGMAAGACYVHAFGTGRVVVPPERAVAYRRAGIGAREAWAVEEGPPGARPTLEALQALAALRGPSASPGCGC